MKRELRLKKNNCCCCCASSTGKKPEGAWGAGQAARTLTRERAANLPLGFWAAFVKAVGSDGLGRAALTAASCLAFAAAAFSFFDNCWGLTFFTGSEASNVSGRRRSRPLFLLSGAPDPAPAASLMPIGGTEMKASW